MIDIEKTDIQIRLEMVSLWIEVLQKKKNLSDFEKDFILIISDYLYKRWSI